MFEAFLPELKGITDSWLSLMYINTIKYNIFYILKYFLYYTNEPLLL